MIGAAPSVAEVIGTRSVKVLLVRMCLCLVVSYESMFSWMNVCVLCILSVCDYSHNTKFTILNYMLTTEPHVCDGRLLPFNWEILSVPPKKDSAPSLEGIITIRSVIQRLDSLNSSSHGLSTSLPHFLMKLPAVVVGRCVTKFDKVIHA